jgi:hypothetical protein
MLCGLSPPLKLNAASRGRAAEPLSALLIGDVDGKIGKIDSRVNGIEDRALPVSWKSFRYSAGIIGGVITAFVGFYMLHMVPTEIASQFDLVQLQVKQLAASSQSPNGEINAVNKRLDELNSRLAEGLKKQDDRIDKLYASLVVTPRKLTSSLERARPKRQDEAKSGFPVMRELLAHARQEQVVLQTDDLKKLALPLLNSQYSEQNAKDEAWATAKEFAAYRTVINRKQFGAPKPPGGQAENYFNGGVQDLGGRSLWKDTVFVNCRINISSAEARLILDNVRFINCDFQLLEETDAGRALVGAVLSSNGPAVSAPLLDHQVPDGKTTS